MYFIIPQSSRTTISYTRYDLHKVISNLKLAYLDDIESHIKPTKYLVTKWNALLISPSFGKSFPRLKCFQCHSEGNMPHSAYQSELGSGYLHTLPNMIAE